MRGRAAGWRRLNVRDGRSTGHCSNNRPVRRSAHGDGPGRFQPTGWQQGRVRGLRLDCPVGRRLYSRDPEGEALAKTALWLYFREQIFGSSDPQELKPKWQKLALTILFDSTGGEPSFLDR